MREFSRILLIRILRLQREGRQHLLHTRCFEFQVMLWNDRVEKPMRKSGSRPY